MKKSTAKAVLFFNDVFRFAERDVCFASDVPFGRDVCLRHESGTHHFAAKPQNITVCKANNITCAAGADITLNFSFMILT